MSDSWNLMEYVEEESGGTGGWLTEVMVEGSWFVFRTGVLPDDRHWVFNGKEESAAARQKALAYVDEHDVKNRKGERTTPVVAIKFTMFANSVINRDIPNWINGSLSNYLVGFDRGYREVFSPSVKELLDPDEGKFSYGERFWAQVSYAEHPENPTYVNAAGEEKANLVPFVVRTFSNRDEAIEALGGDAPVTAPSEPAEWASFDSTPGSWQRFYASMVDEFKNKPDLNPADRVEDSAGITISVVMQAKKEAEVDQIPF
jgi:hypothetical protein